MRSEYPGQDVRHRPCCGACGGGRMAAEPPAPPVPEAVPRDTVRARYRIEGLCCATEEQLIRKRLEGMAGVVRMDFDLLERELVVHHRLADPGAVLGQNFALALGLKAVFLGLALAGRATLGMAVFADMGGSLLVVFNGLRLLRDR